jgi:prophage regulatory protein
MNADETSETMLTFKEVAERVGKPSRATLWRWVQAGIFPAPIKVGLAKIAWRKSDVQRWFDERKGK